MSYIDVPTEKIHEVLGRSLKDVEDVRKVVAEVGGAWCENLTDAFGILTEENYHNWRDYLRVKLQYKSCLGMWTTGYNEFIDSFGTYRLYEKKVAQ